MEHDSWIALISIVGSGMFVLVGGYLTGWLGTKESRRMRGEDLYKDIGRLEGRRPGEGGQLRDFELALMLGELKTGVKSLSDDITEIKANQETNRTRQDKSINDLCSSVRGMHTDLEMIKGQFGDLRRTVANIARTNRSKV